MPCAESACTSMRDWPSQSGCSRRRRRMESCAFCTSSRSATTGVEYRCLPRTDISPLRSTPARRICEASVASGVGSCMIGRRFLGDDAHPRTRPPGCQCQPERIAGTHIARTSQFDPCPPLRTATRTAPHAGLTHHGSVALPIRGLRRLPLQGLHRRLIEVLAIALSQRRSAADAPATGRLQHTAAAAFGQQFVADALHPVTAQHLRRR